ncbi:MAG: TlpA family protein disulfide reductase [Gammaproteobacteria bacterium]|nr:TlpA family protein disulfide reductase [Gammaproteobacteria bacterium]
MKYLSAKSFIPIPVLLLSLGLALAPMSAGHAKSYKAPNFTLKTLDKKTVKLSSYKGKVVYLDFWASWCKPCRKSFPVMRQLQRKYKKQGLRVITINLDKDKKELKRFLKEFRINFPVALDPQGKVARRYGVKAMPSSYLIDRQGRIRHVHLGFLQKDAKKTEDQIKKLLKK